MARAKSITDGLYAIALGGVNVHLIDGPEGLVLIDAGFPGQADKILSAIAGIGRAAGNLRHILLTHAHVDHIGSLAALVRATGAQTWMHGLDVPIAECGSGFRPLGPAPSLPMSLLYRLIYREGLSVEPARIDHTIGDGEVIPLAGGLKAIHAPGHCAGQVAFLWPARGVLFAADACAHLLAFLLDLFDGLRWTLLVILSDAADAATMNQLCEEASDRADAHPQALRAVLLSSGPKRPAPLLIETFVDAEARLLRAYDLPACGILLVRPDGYVAFAAREIDQELGAYITEWLA